jgi:hypothetical protein
MHSYIHIHTYIYIQTYMCVCVLLLYWGYTVTFTKRDSVILFYSTSPLIPEIVSTGLSFPFTCMCTCTMFQQVSFSIYIHVYIIFPPYSPSYTFPCILPPPIGINPPDRTCFAFLKTSLFLRKTFATHTYDGRGTLTTQQGSPYRWSR